MAVKKLPLPIGIRNSVVSDIVQNRSHAAAHELAIASFIIRYWGWQAEEVRAPEQDGDYTPCEFPTASTQCNLHEPTLWELGGVGISQQRIAINKRCGVFR